MDENIVLKGVRVNNLKGVDVEIPLNRFVVITGLSGSGKSSLAFDTLYAEGQRRYVESLSSYARQFLARMKKPDCDSVEGMPPAIAFSQLKTGRNARSTVGTSSEVYDYLRMLYARIGENVSPKSGEVVRRDTIESIVAKVMALGKGTRFAVLAPIKTEGSRSLIEVLEAKLRQGFSKIDSDGVVMGIEEVLSQGQTKENFLLLIDRLSVNDSADSMSRLRDAVETAMGEGNGRCNIRLHPSKTLLHFSRKLEADGLEFEEPTDALFSFNSPKGACPTCEGFGSIVGIDEHLVVPHSYLSVYDGAVVCWRGEKMKLWKEEFCRRATKRGFPIFEPYFNLTQEQKDYLWHGDEVERGLPEEQQVSIDAFFRMVQRNQYKIQYRVMLSRYRGRTTCPTCHGRRLRREAEYVKIDGHSISDLTSLSIAELREFFAHLAVPESSKAVAAARLLTEITARLRTLDEIGLGYLTLARTTNTLSGGEAQRMHIAKSLGSPLIGSLYILDEPSIGLHSRDTRKLIGILRELTEIGNTVVVVEHDEDIIRAADYIIDLGPGAGRDGGEVVFQGTTASLHSDERSYTLRYLSGEMKVPIFAVPRRRWTHFIEVRGALQNNLKNIDVKFPLGVMTAVSGVSGSGKSTLVTGILYPALRQHFDEPSVRPGEFQELCGSLDQISRVIMVDQEGIGKSSRSNPVTYVKAFDEIRTLFAKQPLARQMGMGSSSFSFNSEEGRCERCKGDGVIKVPMQFMADLTLECDECHGKRFKKDVLEVCYEGKNVYDILDMTVDEAVTFFTLHEQPSIVRRLQPLQYVGLGYIKLGQPSSTLSGGENQRLKLACHLDAEHVSPTLFIFDEPTRGLHMHDINVLLRAFNRLIEAGHTIIVIEHNLEVLKNADYLIDLGPEGGDKGGYIVAQGTPEEVVAAGRGYTARYLSEKLG